MLCPAKYVGRDGFPFSCDHKRGHAGPHKAEDYDPEHHCFREAQWYGWDDASHSSGPGTEGETP